MSEDATLDEFVDAGDKKPTSEQKDSERRLGPVVVQYPSDWEIRSMETLYSTKSIGTSERGVEDGQQVPLIKMGDLNRGNLSLDNPEMVGDADELLTEYRLEKGDLLFNTRNTPELVGKTAVWDGRYPAVYDNNILRVRFKSNIHPRFVNYYLSTGVGWRQLKSRVQGTTSVAAIYDSEFDKIEIPLPKRDEQRKIATVLYTVDRAIEKTEDIESQVRRTKKAIVQETLKYGLDQSEISDTDTKLGEIPTHWEICSIDDIVADEEHSFTDGARYALSSAEIHDEGEARAILLQEVGEGEFNDEDPKFATGEKYDEITHRAIYPGEVVVAKMAEPVARACIVPEKYDKYLLGCADVVRIQTNDEFDSRFLMYCMNSHKIWRQAVAHLRGTGRSRINLENIAELELPKPPLNEQIEIADVLESFDQRIQTERDYRDRLRRLKRGLMQDLLSGTVRTTDTNIEIPEEIAHYG